MFGVSGSTVSQYRHQDYSRCPVWGSEAWQAQTFSCVLQHPKHSSEVLVSAQSHQPDVTDVCEHGVDKVLSPLVEDLQRKGPRPRVADDQRHYPSKGCSRIFCGDNLLLHNIGGFSGALSKGRVCRFCMAIPMTLKTSWSSPRALCERNKFMLSMLV